ncbi:SIMPL domain-containing protein [Bacillus sp. RG28]|uniref:SIMPL domain-containing protein n=1 Tax=Gottfriedia endophytica TaxID=2820819 RepID=A0A940SK13_9BACI|nr:SIMPL domain-containing protein [Gottfriedia endophytica]MBP0726590.1 SIMPL domain-containing protein [Gottfriedia endophytica]
MQRNLEVNQLGSFENFANRAQQYEAKDFHTMTIKGYGEIKVKPDEAILTIGVVTKNPDVQKAQQENAMKSHQVVEALRKIGIEDQYMKTASYTVQPKYDYIDGKSVLRGYEVEHLIELTVKNLNQVGLIYKAAVENGATIARNIQFRVSNLSYYEQEAMKLAFLNGREKANQLAYTVGVAINPIPYKIIEGGNAEIQPKVMGIAYQSGATSSVVPPIQTGQLTISAQLIIIFVYHAPIQR